MKKIYLVLIFGLLLSGCGENTPKPAQTTSVTVKSTLQKSKSQLPQWVDNPNLGGEVGAVGIVKKMKNKKKQKYIAKKLAIASFQEQKRVMVESKTINTNDDLTQEIKQTSSNYSSNDFVVKDEFEDKDNYYIWVVVKP